LADGIRGRMTLSPIIIIGGKIKRRFIYFEDEITGSNEPAMLLYRPNVLGRSAIIPLSCAYKYNEPKTRPTGSPWCRPVSE